MKNLFACVAIILLFPLVLIGCGGQRASSPPQTNNKESKTNPNVSGSSKAEFVIKLGHVLAPEHPYQKGSEKFKEVVEQKSNGRIKVDVFHSGQLGGEKELVQGMQGNIIQAGVIGATMGIVEPKFLVLDMPFAFENKEQAYATLDGELGKKLFSLVEEKGLKGLTFWENGFRNITNSKKPIKTPEDLIGLKIRTPENKAYMDTFKALGANPTPISFPELFTALEQKVVDGQENPIPLIHSSKFNEVQKHISLTGHMYGAAPLIMSKKFYDSLPDDLKKVVDDAAVQARDFERNLSVEQDKKLLDDLKAKGMTVTEVDKSLFKEKTKSVYAGFEPTFGKEWMDLLPGRK